MFSFPKQPGFDRRSTITKTTRFIGFLAILFPFLAQALPTPVLAESPTASANSERVSVLTGLLPSAEPLRSRFLDIARSTPLPAAPTQNSESIGLVKQFEETSYYINDAEFITPTLGWAVGLLHWDQPAMVYTATIIHTSDGGDTWTAQAAGLAHSLNGIDMLDANQGWAVGVAGTILHTQDGGLNWNRQAVATTDEFRGVAFTDSQNGWATSVRIHHYDQFGNPDDWRASIWRTANGGTTWQVQTIPLDAAILNKVDFVDALHGWAVGVKYVGEDVLGYPDHRAVIYHTSNGGVTWLEQDFSPEPVKITFTGADFIDPLHGWVVGFHHVFAASEGVIFHTSDGGDTWERQSPNNNLWDVQFIDALRGYAVGFDYIGAQGPPVFRTQDGGATWEKTLMRRHEMDGAYAIAVFEDRAYVLGDNDFQGVSTGPWGVYQPPWGENLFTQVYINTHYKFEDVFFASPLKGWAVGSRSYLPDQWGQVIFHTNDGGQNWLSQHEQSPTINQTFNVFRLDSVYFVDENNGWAVGMSTYDQANDQRWAIMVTNNGGVTWLEQGQNLQQDLAPEFFDVQFLDGQNGWALDVGHYDTVAKETRFYLAHTQDGGQQWEWVNTGLPGHLDVGYALVQGGMDFVDANHAWAAGGLGNVIHTADGGATWITQTLTCDWPVCDKRLFDVDFIDTQEGWIAGEGLYHTTDGGMNWEMRSLPTNKDFHDVQFLDANQGWLAGEIGQALYTRDGGLSWHFASNPDSFANLLGIYFIDPSNGWTVGEMGTILSTVELPARTLYMPFVVH